MPLGKRSDYGDSRYAGVEVPFSADGLVPLRAAVEGGFDFLVAPLTHPDRRPPPPPPTRGAPITPIFTPDQGLFLSPDYGNQVVGKVRLTARRHPARRTAVWGPSAPPIHDHCSSAVSVRRLKHPRPQPLTHELLSQLRQMSCG